MSRHSRIRSLAGVLGALALIVGPVQALQSAQAAPAPPATMQVPEHAPAASTPATPGGGGGEQTQNSPAARQDRKAPPDPSKQAQRHFDLGIALYREGDLRGALTEFRQAHKVMPSYQVLYNLGLVSRELFDWAGALGYYKEYLQRGGEYIPADRRIVIERTIIELGDRLGRLEIDVRGEPAEVWLDELPVSPRSLVAGIPVNPGRHRVRVNQPGRIAQIKTVEVASAANVKVTFNLASQAPKPRPRPEAGGDLNLSADSDADKTGARSSAQLWTWTATVLLAGGAVASGLVARQAADALARERLRFPAKPTALASQQNRTQGYSIAADAMAGTSLVLGAISVYLTWFRGGPADRAAATGPSVSFNRAGYGWSF